MKKNRRYSVSKSTLIIMIILTIICVAVYCFCAYWINMEDMQTFNNTIQPNVDVLVLETIRDIVLVILSICGTNLIVSVLIEVKSKNAFLEDVILNDVIAAPDFYKEMSEQNKLKVYNALEECLYFSYPVVHDMFGGIRNKLKSTIDSYYFESCSYVVSCNINEKYIEKEITKSVSIKSYEKNYIITDFSVGNFSSRSIEGLRSFDLLSLEIDGQKINLKEDISEKADRISNLDEQNKYDLSLKYIYNKPLKICGEKGTQIVVKCKTRTPADDKISTFRVTKPCKQFSLIYNIKQHDKYRLAVDAFGFLDDADDSANNSSDSNINITFNDWIYKFDGVVVSILDKCN